MTAYRPLITAQGYLKELAGTDTLQLNAGATAGASANLPHGAAPTSPVDGDIWTTTAGMFVQVNSSTVGPLGAGGGSGSPGGSSGQIQYNNAGAFDGFTATGDATIDPTTGAVELATVNADVGSFGDSTHVGAFTVNAKGLITASSSVLVTPSAIGAATSQDVQEFTSSGTWTKPSGAKTVRVYAVGGGGGGGNGAAGTNASNRGGGGGGAGGQLSIGDFDAASLSSTVSVTIPAQATATNTGGSALFGSLLTAKGGAGGNTGTTNGGAGASANNTAGGPFQGQPGATGGSTGNGTTATQSSANPYGGGGGGGGGAGISTANAVGNGGDGSTTTWRSGGGGSGGGGAGGTAGGPGTAGTPADMPFAPGDGGGGGASTAGATGGGGGDGGIGGGGGGGGAGRTTGGAGGNGGPARVWVVTTF